MINKIKEILSGKKDRISPTSGLSQPSGKQSSIGGASATTQQADSSAVPPSSQLQLEPVTPATPNMQITETANNPLPSASIEPPVEREGWARLGRLVDILKQASGSFEPLRQVSELIVTGINTFEGVAANRRDFEALREELNKLFEDLCKHLCEPTPPVMTASIVSLAQGIEQELRLLEKRQKLGPASRYAQAKEDGDEMNTSFNMWSLLDEQAAENRLKSLPHSPAATYRSAESLNLLRGGCTNNTRVEVLKELRDWAYDNTKEKIYWMNGMAGTGKTTIAYSSCERLEAERSLAASFFCSRQIPECRNVNNIAPSIAYQLARFSRPFYQKLSHITRANPDVHNRPLDDQLKKLIVDPLLIIGHTLPTNLVVVIDALDECNNDRGVDRILTSLLSYAPELPVKFFVTSRPDATIVDLMQEQRDRGVKIEMRLHELKHATVQSDIRTYLAAELRSPRMKILDADLNTLVERSGALFIYAATVVRYIGSDNFSRSKKRLKEVLDVQTSGGLSRDSGRGIDSLYTSILNAAFENEGLTQSDKEEMKKIIRTVICAQEPLSLDLMARLLGLDSSETVQTALRPLLSVLRISKSESGSEDIITTLHESFPNYLQDKDRSQGFHCDSEVFHEYLAALCFNHINTPSPPFNICGLKSSFVLDSGVELLGDRIKERISEELYYACRYWASHLMLASYSEQPAKLFFKFLSQRFLLWMEVMNLKRCIDRGVWMLYELQLWLKKILPRESRTSSLCQDTSLFAISFFKSPARHSTPHIYVSGLSLWPENSPIKQYYKQKPPCFIAEGSSAIKFRQAICLFKYRTGKTRSLKYSPDGAYIITCNDHSARIFNVYTGQMVGQPLEGHESCIQSVAYSPNGNYVAASSYDKTICIWDVPTCQMVGQLLDGHADYITSVAYSPNGAYIASGSFDCTICIWDAHTGHMVKRLPKGCSKPADVPGHSGSVRSVAFSPSGTHIASGSDDKTIHIWNVETGQVEGKPLTGHASDVCTVTYSPDGAFVASGSYDNTIRIWDISTRKMKGQPLRGHKDTVLCVSYSPNGAYIASSSIDKTVCIWDVRTGQAVGNSLRGHTQAVYAVAYSPDGAFIASGSWDSTICIWDVHNSLAEGYSLEGHTDSVNCVAYSPDGACVASSSDDRTVRVWNVNNNQMVGKPLQNRTNVVSSIAYSRNGKHVALGSSDGAIRISNAYDFEMLERSLEGNNAAVCSIAYSHNDAYIVSSFSDRTVRIWDTRARQMTGEPLKGDNMSTICSVTYSPDGASIAAGSNDGGVCLWAIDPRTGRSTDNSFRLFTPHKNCLSVPFRRYSKFLMLSVSFSPSSLYLAAGSDEGGIHIWDVSSGESVKDWRSYSGAVYAIAYSPNGAYIASGHSNHTIRIWSAQDGEICGILNGHVASVRSIAYSLDGAYIVSGSDDHAVRVWNAHQAVSTSLHPQQLGKHICNSHCQLSGHHGDWTLSADGWAFTNAVVDKSHKVEPTPDTEYLVFIPRDLRGRVLCPNNAAVLYRYGVLKLKFDSDQLGNNWSKNFQPLTSN